MSFEFVNAFAFSFLLPPFLYLVLFRVSFRVRVRRAFDKEVQNFAIRDATHYCESK